MARTFPSMDQLFAPVQEAVSWLAGGTARSNDGSILRDTALGPTQPVREASQPTTDPSPRARSHARTRPSAPIQRTWGGPLRAPQRPLRVVRVVEHRHARSNAGRMVISGCMADVCAELERMVAAESGADCSAPTAA